MPKKIKWYNLVLAIAFAWFAYVQLNDPDSEKWVAMYGSVALVCAIAAFGRYFLPIIYLGLAISAIWMLSLLPDFISWVQGGAESIVESMKTEKPHIELTREFLGLVIVIMAYLSLLRQAKKGQ